MALTIDNFVYNQPVTKYANNVLRLEFITPDIKNVDESHIRYLRNNVNNVETIGKIVKVINDIVIAIKIEASIFEFTLVFSVSQNFLKTLMPSIYHDKVNNIMLNLSKSHLDNNTLCNALLNGDIDPQQIAFLRPQDIHPERWKTLIKKANLKDEKKKNMAISDLYKCKKCKGKKCRMIELQLRCADEPTTKIVTCIECYHVMKF